MAKKYENDKGFLIIEMDYNEAKDKCDFGIDILDKDTGLVDRHIILCDSCNDIMKDNIYYVAVINRALCKECCDDFISGVDRYEEDIPYEVRHYNYYVEKLNLEKV